MGLRVVCIAGQIVITLSSLFYQASAAARNVGVLHCWNESLWPSLYSALRKVVVSRVGGWEGWLLVCMEVTSLVCSSVDVV